MYFAKQNKRFTVISVGENACSVDEFVSLCAATLVLTGDCYYRHKLDSKCDFTVIRRASNVHDIYMPKVTKELQPEGSEGPHR